MKPFKPLNPGNSWNASGGLSGITIQRPGSSSTRNTNTRPLAQITNVDSFLAAKKNLPKVSSSIAKKKKNPAPSHNFLEPLVELRPASNHQSPYSEKPYTETYKQLQAQLAKSHRKSQKLNLIRHSENNSNYFPSFYEPTQAQILEAENRKNDALLQIYTDSGTFSKVVAMTVAASVLDTKLPYDVVQYPLDNKKREELMKFCHDISIILSIPDMKSLDSNDYRRLWHLFSIFTNAMDQRICADPARCTPDDAKNLNGNPSPSLNGLRNQPPKRKTLEETSSDGELIETIKTFNPNLYHALKDPLERFLIVYGRYVDLGQVKKSNNLRHNVLNEHIQRYHERVAYNMPNASPFKHSTSAGSKMADGRLSHASSYLDKTNKGNQNFSQNPNKAFGGTSGTKEAQEGMKSGTTSEPTGGGSSASSDSFDERNDGSDGELSKLRNSSKNAKQESTSPKKRKGPTPSWVQAYHRSEQEFLWNLIKLNNQRGQASVTPLEEPDPDSTTGRRSDNKASKINSIEAPPLSTREDKNKENNVQIDKLEGKPNNSKSAEIKALLSNSPIDGESNNNTEPALSSDSLEQDNSESNLKRSKKNPVKKASKKINGKSDNKRRPTRTSSSTMKSKKSKLKKGNKTRFRRSSEG